MGRVLLCILLKGNLSFSHCLHVFAASENAYEADGWSGF